MGNVERRFKKRREMLEAAGWQDSFRELQAEAGYLVNRICPTRAIPIDDCFASFKAIITKSVIDTNSDAFEVVSEAVLNLPAIVQRMKAFPKSSSRMNRTLQNAEIKAVEAFHWALMYGVNWAQDPDKRGLEAAAFLRFTQAYKRWEVSTKMHHAFEDELSRLGS